ncbi:zf-HC2 domain-containing protein [Sphaerisporangium sp. NPDC005288]|uniref:anti-sigma factor family protein n=1 Tax=Sphaerisporangium sp. NPDC005288 TaxID=3155114 RepID=UPI0033BCDE92
MTGDTHYDMEILAELAEGLLDGATAARVREHLAVCDPCGESLADLAAVREMLAGVPVPAMPMGVALRIDKALGAEAETRRSGGGLKLDEAPDWDRIMADSPWEAMPDSPWETAPEPPSTVGEPPLRAVPVVAAVEEPPRPSAPQVPEPQEVVRLGVVADDGTVVPARRRRASRRRSWQLPAMASAAAAVVIGVAGVSAGLLSATGTDGGAGNGSIALPVPTTAAPSAEPSKDVATTGPAHPGRKYVIASSDFNYSDTVLRGPLNTYVGAYGPGSTGDESSDPAVMRCITRISEQVGDQLGLRKNPNPIGVDQAFYEGSEATVMAFWKNRLHNAVWVYVVDDNCRNMRPPSVSRWQ